MNPAKLWRIYRGKPKSGDFVKATQPEVLPESDEPEYLDAKESAAQWREAVTPHEGDKRT